MNHYELVIGQCKKFERILEERFGAAGRGLHEKISSVADRLPEHLVKKLRYIATVRNKLVHEDSGNRIDDVKGYKQACQEADAELKRLSPKAKFGCAALVLLLLISGLGIAMGYRWR